MHITNEFSQYTNRKFMKEIVQYIMLENLSTVIEDQINYTSDILKQEFSLPPRSTTLSFLSKLYLFLLEEKYDYDELVSVYINGILEPLEEKEKTFTILKNVINLYPPYMQSVIDVVLSTEITDENLEETNTLKVELNKYVI